MIQLTRYDGVRMSFYIDVDPRTLHVPTSRIAGADPAKLAHQLSKYGLSTHGMPPIIVIRDGKGALQILDGVTRATRVAKWLPGQLVRVEVTEDYPNYDFSSLPTIGDLIP
jgi:hypothetical protein